MAEPGPSLVTIERIGSKGDGVAVTPEGPLYVPLALPGEQWSLEAGAARGPLGAPSPLRRAALCRHFGTCGGCIAQHMTEEAYRAWKRDTVIEAFRQQGLAVEVAPMTVVVTGSRRRATFAAKRGPEGVRLGFRARAAHTIVDLAECPVLAPRLAAALPGLRRIAGLVLKPGASARVTVTEARQGLDVGIAGAGARLTADLRQRLAGEAAAQALARLIVDGEPILSGAAPSVLLAGVEVALPELSFLQAVEEAESLMVQLALQGLEEVRSAVDLFCGLGPFTFALARRCPVAAFDGDARAIEALTAAARRAQGLKPIAARRRDLFREPLSVKELERFDGAVLDPPRAGAAAQVTSLARSNVRRIVMVSCNPATLARDVAALVEAGYRPGPVTPIDQFVFSTHVETIVALVRR